MLLLLGWNLFVIDSLPIIKLSFVRGRFILESVVLAHEIIHEAARNKDKGLVHKLDYKNVQDRVSWTFLEEILATRGFGVKWRPWILSLVKGGSIKPGKGLRHGDPLSHALQSSSGCIY
jgi:hypothetical protein